MSLRSLCLLLPLGLFGLAAAQPATPAQRAGVTPQPGFSTMHLETKIGSCKFIDGTGRVEISFSGSLLISQLKGTRVVSGNLTRQYHNPKENRELFYGRGRIVITGSWRGMQWFGRDMRAVFYGRGTVRLAGEYYESPTKPGTFESGWFWYEDPTKRQEWPANGTFEQRNPPFQAEVQEPKPVVPRRRT